MDNREVQLRRCVLLLPLLSGVGEVSRWSVGRSVSVFCL